MHIYIYIVYINIHICRYVSVVVPLENESKGSHDNRGDDMTVCSKNPMVHAMLE